MKMKTAVKASIFTREDGRFRQVRVVDHDCEMVLDGPRYNPSTSIVVIDSQIGHSAEEEARLCAAAPELEACLYGLLATLPKLRSKRSKALLEEVKQAKAVLRFCRKGRSK